jgi:hypothetical protein
MPYIGLSGTAPAKAYGWGSFAAAGNFSSIATATVGSGGSSTITFSSIPQIYTHLQLRMFAQSNYSFPGSDGTLVRFNGDTTTTNRYHQLFGNGTSMTANSGTGNFTVGQRIGNSTVNGFFGAVIFDILDYTSTNKNKVTRSLGGVDWNGSTEGQIYYNSSIYLVSNTAISSMTITPGDGTLFTNNSHFALYGIKTVA